MFSVMSVGGNIMAARPTAFLAPLLMAVVARLTVASQDASKTLLMDSSFYVGHKQTVLQPNEVLISVLIPLTRKHEYVYGYKQARRHDNDTAFVNTGMQVLLEKRGTWLVKECNIGCAGMASCPLMATKTQKSLLGKPWSESTLEEVSSLLLEDFPLQPDSPGGRVEYRQSLLISFFFKFYLRVLAHVHSEQLPTEMLSAIEPFSKPPTMSSQGFQTVPGAQLSHDAVGRPMMHLSALKQATGEARYIDDIPHIEGELCGAVVLSTHSHAKITVDASEAEKMDGVHAFISVSDVTGSNITGTGNDEEVFADGKVIYAGQLVGMVVAETRMQARRAAKAVSITYEDLPTVLTNEEAIVANQFFSVVRCIESGDVDSALSSSDHVIEGQMHVGGQEHYYMETSSCLVVPRGEDGEIEVFSSTQGLKETQMFAAKALGVPANRVVVRVKRIGGGFGGKETRTAFLTNAAALAAQKLKTPVRSILDRWEDMTATGKRHPLLAKYKMEPSISQVGFTKEGKLTALDVELYINGGAALDVSVGVIERAMQHSENCYKVPNVRIVGKICKTNLPPNTSFRGFGGPQGMLIAEHWINDVAVFLQLPADEVRQMNLYSLGDITPYGQELDDCQVRRCWEILMGKASYKERRVKVDNFNKHNRWKKRGLAIIPTKYGVCFGTIFHNQGGALVHIYTDGSVLLTHGGMEMGQGLHTKMIQVCARCLDISTEKIHITETATNCVANASPTAGSVSCDLNGMAIKIACDQLMERLAPYKEGSPKAGWEQWVMSAYMDRVNLTAQGFYKTPGIWFDWTEGKGRPFHYTTYGASCTEVEVDSLTGGWQALRSDLLIDVGDSINPALDIGQVEGAFTQGMGLFTMEEYVYLEGDGNIPRGYPVPQEYKIPTASSIPAEFNCSLLDRTPNPKAIFSSKAVGEPPLLLAASVFFALKDAVAAARAEAGLQGLFPLDSPATVERIRMACVDQFTKKVKSKKNSGTCLKWNVAV